MVQPIKDKLLFFLIIVTVLSILKYSIFFSSWPEENSKPFETLQDSDIAQIYITRTYPYYELSLNEKDELIRLLNNIVIFERYDNFVEYEGFYSMMFKIRYTNGESISVSGSPPLFFINDVAYKTEYEPCHKVSNFYWNIVKTKIQLLD